MLWILLSLLAPLLWAASNLIDGHLVRHELKNAGATLFVTGLVSGVPAIVILGTQRVAMPPGTWVGFGLVTGVVSLLGFYPYFRALKNTEPSSALLLWNLSPVIVAALAFVFLHERLSASGYVAISLLVVSAVIVSLKKIDGQKGGRAAVWWMLLASALTALQAVMEKKLFSETPFLSGFALISIGSFAAALPLLVMPRVRHALKAFPLAKGGALVGMNEGLNLVAVAAKSFAISLGPVSLVEAIGGLQPLLILALGWLAWQVLRLRVRKADIPLTRTLLAAALAIIGLGMLGG